ncbi:MAG: 2-oxoacid:acceptor oxidoreductase subunit alpha [Syntrophobacterales bacterium]|jgi:2-oxoglutarate ferredoxin oxidoreductase subunit alpha|nr:2-oxoacid:acceptor oxidoreductase subunit alpha [Syntrophobacterales bacterium]
MAIDLNIVIGGAAGQGVHVITGLLARIMVRQGCRVLYVQDYQSRIRGGHLFNRIRVADHPLVSSREGIDLLVALNQETVALHRQELWPHGVIIYDASMVSDLPPGVQTLPLKAGELLPEKKAAAVAINAGASGAILGLLKLPLEPFVALLMETFKGKGQDVVEWDRLAATAGFRQGEALGNHHSLASITPPAQPRILISGHEAVALGALAAGLQFVSGYPMTPWSSVLNAVGSRADRWGVVVEQAEDEIAAINMALGASYAGVRALTGSSGGGFALMVEALGLAGCSETPLVIIESQRPGPSTGLPTRTSQGDLSFVLSAGQDDFPRAVLAPGSPAQAFALTARAFNLADRYQLPVFVLTDQYLADTNVTLEPGDFPDQVEIDRALLTDEGAGPYERYALTGSGISPRRRPGFGPVVVADSDEHTPDGHLTEDLEVRVKMHDKRLRKLKGLGQELGGITTAGPADAPLALACWGSSLGPVEEAVTRLNHEKTPARMVHFSELWPFPAAAVSAALGKPQKLVMVEMNATGQCNRLLRQETGITADHLLLKYDGAPFTPEYILRALAGQV